MFLIILILKFSTYADLVNAQTVTTPYVYPVVPGTPQWKALRTFQEKLDICQIPQDTLTSMTTDALITTCLSYPLFATTLAAHEGGKRGLDFLLKEFNGMRELIKRKDAGSYLIVRYRAFNPLGYDTTWPSIKRGGFAIDLFCLETLLSEDSIISNMSDQERRDLLSLTIDKFKLKQQGRLYRGFDFTTSALLAGRILLKEGYEEVIGPDLKPIHLSDHVNKGMPMDKAAVMTILDKAKKAVNESR
jgi:hypothetical protein